MDMSFEINIASVDIFIICASIVAVYVMKILYKN